MREGRYNQVQNRRESLELVSEFRAVIKLVDFQVREHFHYFLFHGGRISEIGAFIQRQVHKELLYCEH